MTFYFLKNINNELNNMTKEFMEKILVCPNCKGSVVVQVSDMDELGIKNGFLMCNKCYARFEISYGILDWRKIDRIEGEIGELWDLKIFEKRYESLPIYRSAIGCGNLVGIPELVSRFTYPGVKDRILDWLKLGNGDLIVDVG